MALSLSTGLAQDASGRGGACPRLEAQLASLDRGGGAEQVRRLEDGAARQQVELDRMNQQSQRLGCGGGGFFLFGGTQSPQCDQLNTQIQRARSNLANMMGGIQRAQGGSTDEQRRAVILALAQNNCGAQYRAASAPAQPRGFLESLFGASPDASAPVEDLGPPPEAPRSSSYRTLCVRTCDGYYFPISNAAPSSRFAADERTCQRLCPAAEVALFSHPSGGDARSAVSISGQPYTSLANAFRYRTEYNPSCSCKKPGESWASAVSGAEDTVERGDIVVTEEQSKAMAQPKPEAPARPARSESKSRSSRQAPPEPPR